MKYMIGLAAYYVALYYAMRLFVLLCRMKP